MSEPLPRRAVVLAGGQGQRLRPYTLVLPKPLLPVGEKPILHRVLTSLGDAGFRDITISVGHLSELIMAFFGDGSRLGVSLDYAFEEKPRGTIGPLAHIARLGDHFLVMNGDVLTDLDYNAVWEHHLSTGAALTIATIDREVRIDFGVLHRDPAGQVTDFIEKPRIPYTVSMGVYILSRRCLDFVPAEEHFGFDKLVLAMLAAGEPIQTFLHCGRWLDLGRPEDYETAKELFA
jgi:NDP-sugar pyrophosphorylase family protein